MTPVLPWLYAGVGLVVGVVSGFGDSPWLLAFVVPAFVVGVFHMFGPSREHRARADALVAQAREEYEKMWDDEAEQW